MVRGDQGGLDVLRSVGLHQSDCNDPLCSESTFKRCNPGHENGDPGRNGEWNKNGVHGHKYGDKVMFAEFLFALTALAEF